MPVYNHHTPCINVSQGTHINIIHPSSEQCRNPWCKTTEPCEKLQIEHLHFAATVPFDSLVGDATPVDITPGDVTPPLTLGWSRFVNRRALPPRTCIKLWLIQVRSPSYITHRAMRTTTTVSSVDPGASRHCELHCKSSTTHNPCSSTNLAVDSPPQHNTNNDPSIKFFIATSTTKDDFSTIRN